MEASRDTLIQLLELQKIDSTIDRLEARRRNLPEQAVLEELEQKLISLEKAFGEQQAITDEIVSRQSKLDGEIEMITLKFESEEKRLYSGTVTTPKELSSIQAELESLKRRKSGLEDSDLEVMEELEGAEKELTSIQQQLDDVRDGITEATVKRDAAAREIDEQLGVSRAERDTWVPKFPADLLSYYDDLRASRGGVAIAALTGGMCQGCHMQLPVQEAERVKRSQKMSFCDECRRILVPL